MAKLDDKGRCCGRKPIVYKSKWSTAEGPQKFCTRCDRSFHLETGEQIPNWAWCQVNGEWKRKQQIK